MEITKDIFERAKVVLLAGVSAIKEGKEFTMLMDVVYNNPTPTESYQISRFLVSAWISLCPQDLTDDLKLIGIKPFALKEFEALRDSEEDFLVRQSLLPVLKGVLIQKKICNN